MRSRTKTWIFSAVALILCHAVGTQNASAAVIAAPFDGSYTLSNLGSITGVTANYGGLTLLAGDNNTLLIGGSANSSSGKLYTVGLVRDVDGHITGFSGAATEYGTAPYNDGGIVYGPGGVLFSSQWPVNMLSQFLPGSTSPDKVIDLSSLGVAGSNSAINFVPAGFSGAGGMKLVSYIGGQFYSATYSEDGSGTYDITSVSLETILPGGPEGFVYVPTGSPELTVPSMLVSEYAAGRVGVYDVDSDGNPIPASRRDFITGLGGAEGAFIDPVTGDFLFSTFGSGNEVFVVRGFAAPPDDGVVPEPASVVVFGLLGVCAMVGAYGRRATQVSER